MAYELIEEDETQEESIPATLGRNVARQGTNIVTRGIGLPGDIFKLVNDFIAKPTYEAISEKKGTPYEKTTLGKLIPTTEQHRQGLQNVTGDYLEPKNKIESFVDDVIEDTALLFVPGAKGAKTGTTVAKAGQASKINPVVKNLSKSVGANLAGETVEQTTGSKGAGLATKGGALFLSSLLDTSKTATEIGKLYKSAEKAIPKNATASASKLSNKLKDLENTITKGRPNSALSPGEKFVMKQINNVKSLIKDGKIRVDQAWAQKKSLYEELDNLYKDFPTKGSQKGIRNLSKKISGYLNNTLEEYGKSNKNFLKNYKSADQAFGTIAKSNIVSNWVRKNLKSSPLTHGLLHLFGGPIGGAASTAALPYQAGKLLYRISKSPTLAKLYGKAIKAASREDVAAFNKYLTELDRDLQHEEAKERYEFID